MMMMASIPFSGEYGDPEFTNVNAAAAELRKAGFQVFRLPDKYRGLMAHPFDDFIEVRFEGSVRAAGAEPAWCPHYAAASHVAWWKAEIKKRGSLEAIYRSILRRLKAEGDAEIPGKRL